MTVYTAKIFNKYTSMIIIPLQVVKKVSYLHWSYPHSYWGMEVWRPPSDEMQNN